MQSYLCTCTLDAPLLLYTIFLWCVDAFCESVEQDASERAERRLEREKKGRELKGAGNAAFRSGQFDTAVERYSSAIERTPWDATLYTNRAQVCVCGCGCMCV